MVRRFAHHLYACGREGLPEQITCVGASYRREKVFKRDFFAETGLYARPAGANGAGPARVVLKMNRRQSLFGLPLWWVGRMLCRNEVQNLQRLADIPNVPKVVGQFGAEGFVYEFIPGRSLDERPAVTGEFFEKLRGVVAQIHGRDMAYLDMNKRSNIIVGDDGEPHVIDFQISQHISGRGRVFGWFWRRVRRMLQREDMYHLVKQKRRLLREEMTDEEWAIYRKPSGWIRVHRAAVWPFRAIRRSVLRVLYRRRVLDINDGTAHSPEHDPAKYLR